MNNQFEIGNPSETKQQYIYFFKLCLLILAYGINGTTYTSLPFLFYKSILNCVDKKGYQYECSVEQACQNNHGYIEVSEYPQIYNITQQLQLYCDHELIETWILTLANIGKLISYAILLVFPVKKEKKEMFMNICIIAIAAQLCLLQWIQTTSMFIIMFFIWYLFFNLYYCLIFTHIVEEFPEKMSTIGIPFVNMTWSVLMCEYVIYTYYFGSWQNSLIHYTGIPLLIIGFLRLYLTHISLPDKKIQQIGYSFQENTIDVINSINKFFKFYN